MVEVFGKVFTRSPSQSFQRRPTSACGGVYCTRASDDLIARASGGVPCSRTSGILFGIASGGVYCTRASSGSKRHRHVVEYIAPAPAVCPSANAIGGVPCTCARGCFKRQRQQWSTLHLCPRCFKHQHQLWSTLHPCPPCFTRQCSLSLRMHRTRLRLKTCTRAPGSRCQCPSKLVHRSRVRSP